LKIIGLGRNRFEHNAFSEFLRTISGLFPIPGALDGMAPASLIYRYSKKGGKEMKRILFSSLLSAVLLASPLAIVQPLNAQVSVGIRIGPPPAPRVLHVVPRRPGPDYLWIEGYWYPKANGRGYNWHQGYWTRPPFIGARWVPPHYDGQRFYDGYWQNGNRRVEHDHRWDHNRVRDYDYR